MKIVLVEQNYLIFFSKTIYENTYIVSGERNVHLINVFIDYFFIFLKLYTKSVLGDYS